MSNYCCNSRNLLGCTGFAIIVSVIIGVITAFLTFTATIAITTTFLWVLFGIAVGYLGLVLGVFSRGITNSVCLCRAVSTLLVGILGTVLFSVILLAIDIVTASITGAIIIGLLLLAFSLIITSTACAVRCALNCDVD